ncbi:MAG: CHRD domain-containing protein [Acidobacteria bacterium]|nr:CHRD domain-containing protein [Acidobacteriota bacterium]
MKWAAVAVVAVGGWTVVSAQSEIPTSSLTPPPAQSNSYGAVSTTLLRAPLMGVYKSGSLTILAHRAVNQPLSQNRLALEFLPSLADAMFVQVERAGGASPKTVWIWTPTTNPYRVESTDDTRPLFDEMVSNPERFHVVLYDSSGAAYRGQLASARRSVVMALMNPGNEVAPIAGYSASATAAVIADVAHDAAGAIVSAGVTFNVSYQFPESVLFTGLHIHSGVAGVNGPVIIDSGLRNVGGASPGYLSYTVEADVSRPEVRAAIQALEYDPSRYYINLHTSSYPAGVIRAQLRPTETVTAQTGYGISYYDPRHKTDYRMANAARTAWFLREVDGVISAAMQAIDVHYDYYPSDVIFIGDLIGERNSPKGGVYSLNMVAPQYLDYVDAMTRKVESGCVNLNTADAVPVLCTTDAASYGGKLRVDGVRAPGSAQATFAPGEVVELYGSFPGIGATPGAIPDQAWPFRVNGLEVTIENPIGDAKATVLRLGLGYVSWGQINAQLPFELTPGQWGLRYWNLGYPDGVKYRSDAFPINVVSTAPVILGGASPLIFKADGTRITAGSPVAEGDVLTIYATGLGRTTPATATGQPASANAAATVSKVSIAGITVAPTSAMAFDGLVGVYVVTVRIPAGAAATLGATALLP